MSPDLMFRLANMTAVVGWLTLLASPWLPTLAQRVAATVLPLLLSVTYSALILAFWSRAPGGFDSLDHVAALFTSRDMLLAGWLHYLAFDLFVGAWEVRVARTEAIPFVLVAPCLALTFLFGPAGFLLFIAVRTLRGRMFEAQPA